MKVQSNQSLNTLDIIHVIITVIFLVAIIAPILHANHIAKKQDLAQNEAKKIADSIITKLQDANKLGSNQKRTFASLVAKSENSDLLEGVSGTDPWGQSFKYKVLRDAFGTPTHIVVWSTGPNSLQETLDQELSILNAEQIKFSGDDLGTIKAIRL